MNILVNKKEIHDAISNKYKETFWEVLSIIFSSESEIPKTSIKKYFWTKILRNLYAIIIAFFVLIGFVSFILLTSIQEKQINEPQNIAAINTFIKIMKIIEFTSFFIFLIDLLGNWITYPFRDNYHNKVWKSITLYPFTSAFIILVLNFLPSLAGLISVQIGTKNEFVETMKAFRIIRILRLIMLLNIFASFKKISYAIKNDRVIIINIILLTIVLLFIFSIVVYYTETEYVRHLVEIEKKYSSLESYYEQNPSTVKTFGDTLYFAAITLTTIGYGDFTPKSNITKAIIPILSVIGIAIIATPGGIISASVLTAIKETSEEKEKNKLGFRKGKILNFELNNPLIKYKATIINLRNIRAKSRIKLVKKHTKN
ncbi:Ion channel [Mycoplasmopsis maculosa]|uniref:Ion channel n=1 Tax=Mycoplasmopsis maculosa TaxID=114885 RepID=A0A449B591_9BACT|nr:potassium channel family protein [Mycoplasmopsis maculosa]VEU75735.1 Ion channel [Mycoplasmopsis maculosa]